MFDELFNKIKTDVENWVKTGLEQATKELAEKFKLPEPDGEFNLIHRFGVEDRPISTGGLAIEGNSWRIEAYDDGRDRGESMFTADSGRQVQLFQIDRVANSPECLLCCRANIRAANLTGTTELKLGVEGAVDFWGIATPPQTQSYRSSGIEASNELRTYEIIYHYTPRNYPSKILVNIDFQRTGVVWIASIELLQASVKKSPPES